MGFVNYFKSRLTISSLKAIAFLSLLMAFFVLAYTERTRWLFPKSLEQNYTEVTKLLNEGLTMTCRDGQLGNKMFYYAVVLGVSFLNRRPGFIQRCNSVSDDDSIFPGLSLPVLSDLPESLVRGHRLRFHSTFPEDLHIPERANCLTGEDYPVSVTHFLFAREEVRRHFRFGKPILDRADSILTSVKGKRDSVTFVSVHVRRGSYLSHLEHFGLAPAPLSFYYFGFRYFRRKFSDAVFVVLSDDGTWCKEVFKDPDIFFPAGGRPYEDLAVLSSCNHSLFDYGTYGFWGAFLAGGEALYFADGIVDTQFVGGDVRSRYMYPPEWTPVSKNALEVICPS